MVKYWSDSNQGSNYIAIFVSLISGSGCQNLISSFSGKFMSSPKSRYRCWYCAIGNINIQNIAIKSSSYIAIILFWMFILPMAQYHQLYPDLGENINSPSNDVVIFWNFVLLNQKLEKQKWQCSKTLIWILPVFNCRMLFVASSVFITTAVKRKAPRNFLILNDLLQRGSCVQRMVLSFGFSRNIQSWQRWHLIQIHQMIFKQ